MRLLAVGSRQRTTCNLRTQRIALVALEQVCQLLADAVVHRSLNWLHCPCRRPYPGFPGKAATRAAAPRGNPGQLLERPGAVLVRNLLDLAGDLVWTALLAS